MEKSCHSSGGGDSAVTTASTGTTSTAASITVSSANHHSSGSNNTSTNNNNNRDGYLKHLNKISHKISKPIKRFTNFEQNPSQNVENLAQPQPTPQNQAAVSQPQQPQPPPQQHQPPVYNINKNDFRDVVQRLTGSPVHERISTPPPIQPPKPPSSRLQRIRPPPLAQISNRPPQLPQLGNQPGSGLLAGMSGNTTAVFLAGQRQPLSPLPPFPAVHAAAESPISAYMRFLQNSAASAASPKWNNLPPPQLPPLQQNIPPPPQSMPQFPLMPTSPLPFGCIPSPRSPYPLLSPSMLFSPTQLGFQQLPLSPTLPVPSPTWKGV